MDSWVRPRPGRIGYRRDVLLALAMALGTALSAALYTRVGLFTEPAPPWVTALVLAGLTLPLALRRRFPALVAIVISLAFFVAVQFLVPEALFTNIALFLAIYSLGAWSQNRRRANVVRAVIVTAMLVWLCTNIGLSAANPETMEGISTVGLFSELVALALMHILTNLLFFVGAWVFGNTAWSSARQRAQLEATSAELLEERERSANQAVALDRVRIARELHDVVAHHVSMMGLQAGAARRVVLTDPAQASTSLESIEQSARSAVDEMHRLLATLRDSESDPASSSASTRGIAQLDDLVGDAGLPVSFQIIGEPQPVSSLVGFTIYRVAQEALTNVRKHAGEHAAVDLRLRYLPDTVELEVTNTGSTRPVSKPGLGHIGMRERLAAVNGTLEVGRRDRGGYLVRATIPLAAT